LDVESSHVGGEFAGEEGEVFGGGQRKSPDAGTAGNGKSTPEEKRIFFFSIPYSIFNRRRRLSVVEKYCLLSLLKQMEQTPGGI